MTNSGTTASLKTISKNATNPQAGSNGQWSRVAEGVALKIYIEAIQIVGLAFWCFRMPKQIKRNTETVLGKGQHTHTSTCGTSFNFIYVIHAKELRGHENENQTTAS